MRQFFHVFRFFLCKLFQVWYRVNFVAPEIQNNFYMEILTMAVSQELLDILVCPKCKGKVILNETHDGLICNNCSLVYEIRDDIPVMLIDEAKPFEK